MIGSYVRQLRERNGYLLRQMAAELDIDPTILSKMEREERPFKREIIINIANICSCNEEDLLTIWLADKIYDVIKEEKLAKKSIKLALDRIVNYE